MKLNQPVDRKIISIGKVSSGVTIAGLALTNKIIESAIQTEKPIEEAVILVSLPQDAEVDNKLDEEQEISSITKSPILRQETVTNATRTTPCVIFELLEGVAEVGKGVLTVRNDMCHLLLYYYYYL